MLVKVVTVKLGTTPEAMLADTMQRFNQACNHLSRLAWETQTLRAFDLHKLAYHQTRQLFGLPAQLTVRAIAKVVDSYKTDRSRCHTFGPRSAVVFDARCFKLKCFKRKNLSRVELTTTQGRKSFVMAHGAKQRADLDGAETGEAYLLYRDGSFYLSITVKKPEPPAADTKGGVLGVDLGIVELATDSEGKHYSGAAVKALRHKIKRIRSLLQRRGSKSAKDHLKRLRRRQSNFVRDVNHCISKAIVQTATLAAKALSLEALKGIRERASVMDREMRWLLGNWAFADLAAKIVYKAKQAGIAVCFVDPRNTSRTCSCCGYCDKANRKSKAHFQCLQCGFCENADKNAARTIEARAAKSRQSGQSTGLLSQPV